MRESRLSSDVQEFPVGMDQGVCYNWTLGTRLRRGGRSMRKVSLILSILFIVLATLVYLRLPVQTQMLFYPLFRQATQAKLNYETRGMAVYDTSVGPGTAAPWECIGAE